MNKVTELGNVKWVVWLGIVSSIVGIITFLSGNNLPDFFGAKDVPLTSTPYIVIVQPTPPLDNPINTSLPSPTSIPTQEPHFNISGVWDLNFEYKGYTNSSGVFKERKSTETWSINLVQSENNLNGELISVNSKYVDSCINAVIDGAITEDKVTLFIRFNGSCCPNEIARIDGVIEGTSIITGEYQPAKTPSGTCTLSTGTVIGAKQ